MGEGEVGEKVEINEIKNIGEIEEESKRRKGDI